MNHLERLAPGYYRVNKSEQERRRDYSLTPSQVAELLAPVRSRPVADEIARKYRESEERSQRAEAASL